MEIVDLNACRLSRKNGMYGGAAGNKDGVIYNGENWLIKYPKNIRGLERTGDASYSTAPLSEYNRKKLFSMQLQARLENLLLPFYHDILKITEEK